MFQIFGNSRREKRDVAELMREMPGIDAWHEARRRAREFDTRTDDDRAHWSRVSHRIDRILQIDWQPDTATRYLESR